MCTRCLPSPARCAAITGICAARNISSVSGAALVRYQEDGATHDALVPAGEVWRFQFPPGVAHAFKNIGERAFLIVSFNTELHDPAASDAERVELIPA